MYVVAIEPMQDPERSRIERQAHVAFMARLREAGQVWAMGIFPDGSGGMAILRVGSLEEGRTLMEDDPYVTSGARSLVVYPWEPVPPVEAIGPGT